MTGQCKNVIMKLTLMLATGFILGCDSQSSNNVQPPPTITSNDTVLADTPAAASAPAFNSQFERRKFYLYTDNPNKNRTCDQDISNFSNPDEVRCVGEADWQALCNSSSFIMRTVALQLVDLNDVYFEDGKKTYEALRHLIANQGVSGEKIEWNPDENLTAEKSCLVSLTVSGLYEGTYHRKHLNGYARSFMVNDDGLVIVDSY